VSLANMRARSAQVMSSRKGRRTSFMYFASLPLAHDLLHAAEDLLRDDGLVYSLVNLALVPEEADVEWVTALGMTTWYLGETASVSVSSPGPHGNPTRSRLPRRAPPASRANIARYPEPQ